MILENFIQLVLTPQTVGNKCSPRHLINEQRKSLLLINVVSVTNPSVLCYIFQNFTWVPYIFAERKDKRVRRNIGTFDTKMYIGHAC